MSFFFSSHLFFQKGFDVFNALDLMENKTFLEKLKFGVGDGNLQYYLYNWKCPSMGSEKVVCLGLLLFYACISCLQERKNRILFPIQGLRR